jgi:hypothetical protein
MMASADVDITPAVSRLLVAQGEGLDANARRFLDFRGDFRLEIQALNVPVRQGFAENIFAHPTSLDSALRLLANADKRNPMGTFIIANEIHEAVTSRAERDTLHPLPKGLSTTDADIARRCLLFIDIDYARTKGTSSTDSECLRAIVVAERIVDRLRRVVPESSLGLGHSGNGSSVFLALDGLVESPTVAAVCREIVLVLDALFTDPRIRSDRNARDGIDIDTSVTDAKRLCPAFGTVKRKGAFGNQDRPHRRTAFVRVSEGSSITRLALAELEDLLFDLRADLPEAMRLDVDKAMGRKEARKSTSSSSTDSRDNVWLRAREVPVDDVLDWLGLREGSLPKCPGCGECDGSSVVVIGNGLKCSHNRCSQKGKPAGFRTTVDLVVEARNVEPIEAVRELGARFGFEVTSRSQTQQAAAPPVPTPRQEPPPAPPRPSGFTVGAVLDSWLQDGPLVHESTGFPRLDNLTGGGPVFGSRWYLLGSPDAGKTAMLVQLADTWLLAGLPVGILAVDEDPNDVVTRLLQRRGFGRFECETRRPAIISEMRIRTDELALLRIYDATWTIERAAADLAKLAPGTRGPALIADSIQTISCEAERGGYVSPREAVTQRAKAIRAVATKYRMITFTTSEVGRHKYDIASGDRADRGSDMAAAKESGAIEYSARVMLSLVGVEHQPDLLDLKIVKNKHGPRDQSIGLRIDRRLQTLSDADLPEAEDAEQAKEQKKTTAHKSKNEAAALALVRVLARSPGRPTRELPGALRAELGQCSSDLASAALELLGNAIVKRDGARGAKLVYLVGSNLPESTLAALPPDVRAKAAQADAPADSSTPAVEGSDHE